VSKCWLIITSSLHDDLLLKLTVKRGLIQSLMAEINAALQINSAEEIQPLRLELYGATMQKDGNADLQTYIAYLMQRQKKLAAHGKPVEDEEMISIFLKGYTPCTNHFKFTSLFLERCPRGSTKWWTLFDATVRLRLLLSNWPNSNLVVSPKTCST